jgi:hypothetical protein
VLGQLQAASSTNDFERRGEARGERRGGSATLRKILYLVNRIDGTVAVVWCGVECSAVQCSAVQCSAVQRSAVELGLGAWKSGSGGSGGTGRGRWPLLCILTPPQLSTQA